jgi:hypothetical protein
MSDPQAIAALLLETPQGLCAPCLVLKTGIPSGEITATFHRLAGLLRVVVRRKRCAACSKRTLVFALARSPFILGDLVTSRARPDRVGEVVDASRLPSGYVSVCWRTPSGTSLRAVDEPVDALILLPPIKGGSGSVSPEPDGRAASSSRARKVRALAKI